MKKVIEKYSDIYLIIAPPRTSSTAFARVFWEQPSIRYYCHEPFDLIYHRNLEMNDVQNALLNALDLSVLNRSKAGAGLVVKEMTFQVGERFLDYASLTSHPIFFLIRDPRLSVFSRMNKRKQGGQDAVFPAIESGWDDLIRQLALCKKEKIPYWIVDSTDFRNHSRTIFQSVFEKSSLPFSEKFLSWESMDKVEIGQLWDEQSHWYRRVLKSTGLQPAVETPPEITEFPANNSFRQHVAECLEIYTELRNDDRMITLENSKP